MFELSVDYESVRELLIDMAEEFEMLGYPKVLEDFEGSGRIGRAVAKPRTEDEIQVIHVYMKGLGKELLAEENALLAKVKQSPYLKENPQFKQACTSVLRAKQELEETFQNLKKCFVEPPRSEKSKMAAQPQMARLQSPARAALPPAGRMQRMR